VSKDYGYARFWAGALTVLGTLFVLLGFLVAVAAILIPTIGGLFPSRGNDVLAGVVMAILTVLAGALIGGPLIVAGQTLRVLLVQRRLLARLNRRMARPEDR
jgi:formate/nitrite transporter FocA (FNT family)